MAFNRRTLLAGAAAGAALPLVTPLRHARAQAANTIRIGVLNDQSGLYRDRPPLGGPRGMLVQRWPGRHDLCGW
ncbi:hypothetical protein [Elioraea tepidiphila]|mgnify:CR=1 FL=1|uniref:hypothetical protein n=1 Tax=Elioraea tepidiphila TaxID=457934 RepID=UPI002FD92BB0